MSSWHRWDLSPGCVLPTTAVRRRQTPNEDYSKETEINDCGVQRNTLKQRLHQVQMSLSWSPLWTIAMLSSQNGPRHI